jgi:hypothetical protein
VYVLHDQSAHLSSPVALCPWARASTTSSADPTQSFTPIPPYPLPTSESLCFHGPDEMASVIWEVCRYTLDMQLRPNQNRLDVLQMRKDPSKML